MNAALVPRAAPVAGPRVEFDRATVHDPDRRATTSGGDGIVTLDAAVRVHIERALTLTSGRIEGRGGAAAILGLNPHTLRGKMRKLGIDWATFRYR